jgi:DNA-binding GntR family transcriptional regulator
MILCEEEEILVHHANQPLGTAITDCRLNRQSFVPLYQQIKDLLLARIEHGELAIGDVIPSEAQLGAAFQVSRLTVRQALYELRVEGYIIREKGRGTFVGGSVAIRSGPR